MKSGIATILGIACGFLLGWWFASQPNPKPIYPQFECRELHEHTHEGGKHLGTRFYTPVWGKDYDFQYDAQGTHTHKHNDSDVTLTHGHWRLDTPDPDPETFGTVIGLDHIHFTLSVQSKSENWRSSPNGDSIHDHHFGYLPATRTLLYITHSHL